MFQPIYEAGYRAGCGHWAAAGQVCTGLLYEAEYRQDGGYWAATGQVRASGVLAFV